MNTDNCSIILGVIKDCVFEPNIIKLDKVYGGEIVAPIRTSSVWPNFTNRWSTLSLKDLAITIKDNQQITINQVNDTNVLTTPLSNINIKTKIITDTIDTGLIPVFAIRGLYRESVYPRELIDIISFDLIGFKDNKITS